MCAPRTILSRNGLMARGTGASQGLRARDRADRSAAFSVAFSDALSGGCGRFARASVIADVCSSAAGGGVAGTDGGGGAGVGNAAVAAGAGGGAAGSAGLGGSGAGGGENRAALLLGDGVTRRKAVSSALQLP